MKIQHGGWAALALAMLIGCTAPERRPRGIRYMDVTPTTAPAGFYVLRTDHFELNTTLYDPQRREELLHTLETAFAEYESLLGVKAKADAPPMNCFVFARGDEWHRFTVKTTGSLAPVYLQTRRGGYTYGKLFVSRDAGEQDTLTVAAHEGLHLFIASHFIARPPPFIEEGLACCFESVRRGEKRVSINVPESPARLRRLALAYDQKQLRPLRQLLAMHAGQVVSLNILEVETFYGQAWAFVRFLREAEGGKYRASFDRMIADAQAGRLSSDDLSDNPAMVERYLDASLDRMQPEYDRFVAMLAKKSGVLRSE